MYWSLWFVTWANQNHNPECINITKAGCSAYRIHLKREIEDTDPLKRGGCVIFMLKWVDEDERVCELVVFIEEVMF